jgi:HK97 family phage major capsid protein
VAFEELNQYRSIEELTNIRANFVNERKALNDEYDGLPFPIEAGEQFAAKTETIEEIDRRVTELQARARLIEDNAADEKRTESGAYSAPAIVKRVSDADIYDITAIERNSRNREERDQKYRDNAMRAAETLRVASPRYDQDRSRERLANLIDFEDSEDKEIAQRVLTTNSPQYRAAFNRYVKTGGSERAAALAVGVDTTGGFAVPVSFDPTIIAIGAWTAINPFRNTCRIVTISGTDTWQALTATAITAAYALEAAAATEQGPTFARPEFIVKRAHAFVTASYEMAQDRSDLAAELGTLFGEARDNLEENQFAIGAGTTVFPQGMGLKDAYTRVDSVTNDVIAVADIRAVEAALPIRHRLNAAWFLSRAAIRAIQAFETTGGQLFNGVNYAAVGNPLSNRTGNTGLTLLGYPVWETPSMPWTPTTDDTTWGVLANPDTFVIVDRIGMSVKVIPDMLNGATPSFPTGEIGIYAFWRNTARVLNADGGRQGAVQ